MTAKNSVGRAKIKGKIDELSGLKLHGEIITWNARAEGTHVHKEVVAALEAADLDPDTARELLPRHAFSRATKELKENRVIDVLSDGADEIRFQFTAKTLSGDEWTYARETILELNKTTGKIKCPNNNLRIQAQKELDKCLEARTTSDITKIVQRLFERNADLFPVRDQGGVYFVPAEHTTFIAKVELFLTKLGGRITRFPVPAGTQYGDSAVQQSVAAAMEEIIRAHEEAVGQFTINTRKDTIESAAEKIRSTRVKIEAYASYLQDKSADLLKSVDEANAKLVEQVNKLSNQRASEPGKSADGKALFGWSITAVIRWMGLNAWKFAEARKGMDTMGIEIADATIRAQLQAGRTHTRGEPAGLTEEQIKKLTEAAAKKDKPKSDKPKNKKEARKAKQAAKKAKKVKVQVKEPEAIDVLDENLQEIV